MSSQNQKTSKRVWRKTSSVMAIIASARWAIMRSTNVGCS
jgi:hypothetical protein